MNASDSTAREHLAIAEGRAVDRLCDEFEAALKRGQQPSIAATLQHADESIKRRLITELLSLELEYRQQRGEQPVLTEYTEAWPDFEPDISAAFQASDGYAADGTGSRDRSGETLGKFNLLSKVGTGAFGTVYRAHDTKLQRTVAVKIPASGSLRGEARQRFLREARAAAQLRHPCIVQVHEGDGDGDECYIVSDFIEGTTLRNMTKERGFTHAEVASLVAKLADAVHYANTMGIVHRDLKPDNVMIDAAGQPLITDFGLAKKEDDDALKTHEGQFLGTPAYMSPEQATGRGHLADDKSDQWSLGVVLYELLSDRRPYEGSTAEILAGLADVNDPVGPRHWRKAIPLDLNTICSKCLAKIPANRYASCQHLASDLESWLRGEPILARPVSMVERCWRWCQRNKVAAAGICSTVIVIFGSLIIVTALWRAAETARESADKNFGWSRRIVTDITEQLVKDPRIRDREELHDVQASLLESSVDFFENFVSQEVTDPSLQAERGHAYWLLGVVRWRKGQKQEALSAFENATAIYAALSQKFPKNLDHRAAYGWSQGWRAIALHELGRTSEASASADQAIALLEDVVNHDPAHAFGIVKLGACYLQRGILQGEAGETALAASDYQLAVKTLQREFTTDKPFLLGDREYYLRRALQRFTATLVGSNQEAAAIAMLDAIKQSKADDPYPWYQLAIVRLATRDMDGYRQLCREMVQHFDGRVKPEAADRIVYTCVVAPQAVDDTRRLKDFADLALPFWEGNNRLLGAVEFRCGNYDDAIRYFDKAAQAYPRRGWDWAFLAMAYQKAAQPNNARNALDEALAWVATDGLDAGWTEHVESQQLIREAQALIDAETK